MAWMVFLLISFSLSLILDWVCSMRSSLSPVLATSEVILSRAVRALEGEGKGLVSPRDRRQGAVVAPASQ
jgi:hypothetical protein